jgi:hypothetical protein
MRDFETKLRARLERLDAAIPDPQPPAAPVAAMPGRLKVGRRVLVLLAAAAVLVGASAAAAQRVRDQGDAFDPAVERAVELFLDQKGCTSLAEAREGIRTILDRLGRGDWDIQVAGGADTARCVSAGIVAPDRLVVIVGAVGRDVSLAVERIGNELLRQCLDKDEAVAFARSVLAGIGATYIEVRADSPWGAFAIPADQADEYARHTAAGCYVSGGASDGHHLELYR